MGPAPTTPLDVGNNTGNDNGPSAGGNFDTASVFGDNSIAETGGGSHDTATVFGDNLAAVAMDGDYLTAIEPPLP